MAMIDRRNAYLRTRRQGGRGMGLAVALAVLIVGCSYPPPKLPISKAHITDDKAGRPAQDDILPPVTTPSVPPRKTQPRLATYSVVVNEVPVKELLFALARDTKQNIDVHPALGGLVSLNAIDETLPAILDRISKQINIRWKQEGRTISVVPDTPYARTYRVNYVNVTRDLDSTVAVSGQIGTVTGGVGTGGAAGAAATGGAGGGAGGNASTATVTSKSKNDFWDTLEKNLKSMLSATRTLALSAEERSARAEAAKAQREEKIAQAEAVARAGNEARDLFKSVFDSLPTQPLPGDATNEIVVNAIAGTVTVLATERQHQLVQEYLDTVMAASQRQVLIEATIVEVELSRNFQGGVDWGRLANSPGAGLSFSQTLIGGRLGNAPVSALTYSTNAAGNIFATIRLLEQFGNTRVLSSPKVMAINNQTAMLKVVRNVVYFQIQQQISQVVNAGSQTATTTVARTVPIGLVMALTPQINESNTVNLTVRPTITTQVGTAVDPNPILQNANVRNEIPVVEIREIESVLQLGSGQTAILGGLIRDQVTRDRDQLPGVGSTRAGDLFAFRNESARKTELVIFLRPTVVRNPSIETGDLKFLRAELPRPEQMDFRANPRAQ